MAKALMIYGPTGGIASGAEINLFGQGSTLTESFTQVDATEAMTFSGLAAWISGGNSGTATFTFRNDSLDGNQVASRAGTGLAAADPGDSDAVAAGDPFNIGYADTGTNSSLGWVRGNVSFASGHGNVHAATAYASGAVLDVASATRYLPLTGPIPADGVATAAEAQWLVTGYDSAEALQLRISANARTNDSASSLNVNGSDIGTAITVGAGVTGLLSVTGLAEPLADGDLLCASATLGTGVEDLVLRVVAATLKSSTGKSEIFTANAAGWARAASATESFFKIGGELAEFGEPEADARITVGFAHRASRPRILLAANTYSSDATLTVYKNGTAALTVTLGAGATGWLQNAVDTVVGDDAAGLTFGIVGGGTGSITIRAIGLTFEPPAIVVGLTTETDTAFGAAKAKTKAVGQVAEADSAQAATTAKAKAVGLAGETDEALAPAASKRRTLAAAAETDDAFASGRSKVAAVGFASETDAALAAAASKGHTLPLVAEADEAFGGAATKIKAVGVAAETDTALAAAARKTDAVGLATETETAFAVAAAKTWALGLAAESDTAFGAARQKLQVAGLAIESDIALPLASDGAIVVDVASETDAAFGVHRIKVRVAGLALAADVAFATGRAKTRACGQALEADIALALVPIGGGPTPAIPRPPAAATQARSAATAATARVPCTPASPRV